ncbi:MAG: lysophospholipid transporter LplT, partial [Betaproteobacteria bacterium]|nr:lysophospholipid transporter LplT [Betaproteobacteria bacterium]
AEQQLGLPLNKAAILQGVVAVGIAAGAVIAARFMTLRQSPRVLSLGIAMGVMVPCMTLVESLPASYPLLILVGGLAGFFVVPMNALLQHRGHVLMSAGHSIAVQNFNENLNVLLMLGIYALLLKFQLHINSIIVLFGAFVAITMLLVRQRYVRNAKTHDLQALILDHKDGH